MSLYDGAAPIPHWAASHDAALYRGDFFQAVSHRADEAIEGLTSAPNTMTNDKYAMSHMRASAAVHARLVLRAASLLDGWAVSLARWTLEAAATGGAQPGPAEDFLQSCRSALNPPAAELLSSARESGHVNRANISRAIGQCADHHELWAQLAARTASAAIRHGASVASSGIEEHTRLYWTPLHFAAAFGSSDVLEALLALNPKNASTPNGVGFTPLHVAVAHNSLAAAAALATVPYTTLVRDRNGRTPAQLAVEVSPSVSRCRAMLAALGELATGALTRQAKSACAQAASVRKQRKAAVADAPAGPQPAACASGGGWAETASADAVDGASSSSSDAAAPTTELPGYNDDEEEIISVEVDTASGGGLARGGGASAEKRVCEIPVAEDISGSDLIYEYLSGGSPVLITHGARGSKLYSKWRMASFRKRHGAVVVAPVCRRHPRTVAREPMQREHACVRGRRGCMQDRGGQTALCWSSRRSLARTGALSIRARLGGPLRGPNGQFHHGRRDALGGWLAGGRGSQPWRLQRAARLAAGPVPRGRHRAAHAAW